MLVLMDLGSAVLSAEFALDLLPEERRAKVLLTPRAAGRGRRGRGRGRGAGRLAAPRRGRGAPRAWRARAASSRRRRPATQGPQPEAPEPSATAPQSLTVTVSDPLGLHARPAARLVRLAGDYHAAVTVLDLTSGRGPVNARSLTAVGTLGARAGDELLVQAAGPDAAAVLAAIRRLASAGFAEPEATAARAPQPAAGPSAETAGPRTARRRRRPRQRPPADGCTARRRPRRAPCSPACPRRRAWP